MLPKPLVMPTRLALLVALALGLAVPLRARAATRLAIYPLQPLGLPVSTVDSLDATLRARVERLPGVSLLARGRTVAQLSSGAGTLGIRCDGSPDCLARLGKLLGVDEIIYGVASGLGGRTALDLKLVGVASGGEIRRVHATVGRQAAQKGRSALIGGVREAAVRLLDPARWTGALELLTELRGAEVSIDGAPRGKTPLDPIQGLAPGRHALRVTAPGYSGVERFVDVRFDETAEVKLDLAGNAVGAVMYRQGGAGGRSVVPVLIVQEGAPPKARSQRAWAHRMVGATVAFAALGLGAGIVSSVERTAAAGMTRPVAAADEGLLNQRVGRASGFGLAADVLWIASGVSLVTAGVLFSLSGSGTSGSVALGAGPAGLAVAGQF